MTHLKFFIQRAMHDRELKIWEKGLMDMIRIQYMDAYECAAKVAAYIEKTALCSTGRGNGYLTVHIQRLQKASGKVKG